MLHSRSSWAENDAKVGVRGEDLSRVSGSLVEIFTHVSSTPPGPDPRADSSHREPGLVRSAAEGIAGGQ